MNPQPSLSETGLTFIDSNANWGVRDLSLRLTVDGQPAGDGLRAQSTITPVTEFNAVVLTHTITNVTDRTVRFRAATGQFANSAAVLHGKGGWLGWDLRYCHTDNVRTERYPHCQMEYPYVRMLPVETTRLGRGEDQAFPALFIKDLKSKRGLVFAAATQALNYPVFEMRKAGLVKDGIFEHFTITHDPGQADGFELPAGGSITLDGVFIQLTGDLAAEEAFDDYLSFLGQGHKFRGATTPLLREAFHCTWNYGVFADQTEKSLLPTARFIAKNLPNIKWFLMDAGYLAGDIDTTFLDRFYPDPNQFITAEKWPKGIRGYTDELRRLGLRPGIWWSPTARLNSKLYADHPDWFLQNADGTPYRIGEHNGFLDYTVPDALAYLDRTLAVILGEWGMDACKMDFWSQNFEDRDARLRDPRVTAVQARTRFFETIRKHLPADGVFMTCVATGMGNPFIGQWADTYRNTIDIGVGTWHEQIGNCVWALPTLGFEGRKSFLLNNDSVGIMANYPDNENQFRFTWMFMNMGLQETGGRMETWPEKWVKAMRKFTDRCDRGYKVRCPDERAFTGVPLPEVLYVDYPAGSPTAQAGIRQSVALFNWTDEPQIISVLRSRLGQTGPVTAENFWTGERATWDSEFLSQRLEGRSAQLYDIIADP